MVEMMKQTSNWWWFDTNNSTRRSPWLQSTLAELDRKTEAMLKLIEEDADSFAQRAEMYYKKRPELVSMVEEFYRTHRLLAEKYDQVKSESGNRLITTLGSPFLSTKYHQQEKITTTKMDQNYDTYSETSDLEDSASEVDNPEEEEEEEEVQFENKPKIEIEEEIRKLREEVERLRMEKRAQNEELLQKDEEKKEVIRQLSFTVDLLKKENVELRRCVLMAAKKRKNQSFLGKLFKFSPAFIAL